jgi:hypothetical protein
MARAPISDGKGGKRPRNRITAAEFAIRQERALELRAKGYNYQQISDELGWKSASNSYHAIAKALQLRAEQLPLTTDAYRQQMLQQIDMLEKAVWDVLERYHVVLYQGAIVMEDGEKLKDDGPVLAAVDRLIKLQERRAKLTGADAPVRADIGMTVRYQINGVDPSDLT